MRDAAFGLIPVIFNSTTPSDPQPRRRYLLILHNKGHWGFPKGHGEGQETDQQTASREFVEETGLKDFQLLDLPSFSEHYSFVDPVYGSIEKTVVYFIAELTQPAPGIFPSVQVQEAELADSRWCTVDEALQLLTFEAGRQLITTCEQYLQANSARA